MLPNIFNNTHEEFGNHVTTLKSHSCRPQSQHNGTFFLPPQCYIAIEILVFHEDCKARVVVEWLHYICKYFKLHQQLLDNLKRLSASDKSNKKVLAW